MSRSPLSRSPFPPPVRFSSLRAVLPTPPGSPSTKMKLLRESEETMGEMTIESYLYRCDPFRRSSSRQCLPLPWHYAPPESDMGLTSPRLAPLLPFIEATLRQQLPSSSKEFCYLNVQCLSRPGFPGGDERRLTLIIEVPSDAVADQTN